MTTKPVAALSDLGCKPADTVVLFLFNKCNKDLFGPRNVSAIVQCQHEHFPKNAQPVLAAIVENNCGSSGDARIFRRKKPTRKSQPSLLSQACMTIMDKLNGNGLVVCLG